MKRSFISQSLFMIMLALGAIIAFAPSASAQVIEQEPNNTCQTAQNIGSVSLPFSFSGSLDSMPENPDVDFFRFTGTPGSQIRLDLEGIDTGGGTLSDPFMGVFGSDCNLIAVNDDYAGSLNSRIYLSLPNDGIFTVAASQCCDGGFTGGGVGTYRLSIVLVRAARSISGRTVDSVSGEPLSGNFFPFTYVQLWRCSNGECGEIVSATYSYDDGRFLFERDFNNQPLEVGTYQVRVNAYLYEPAQTLPFAVVENEDHDLGDIQVVPLPRAGSISATLVDRVTRQIMPGETPPFARATLAQCVENQGCFDFIANANADGQGRIRFERNYYGGPLLAGDYQIIAYADQYQETRSQQFTVGEGEHRNIGVVSVNPNPVRFTDVRPCANIPPQGGNCQFGVRVINGMTTPLNGGVWSIVSGYNNGPPFGMFTFQTQPAQAVILPSGRDRIYQFQFRVPSGVAQGTYMCTQIYVNRDRASSFNIAGSSGLFCIYKEYSGFTLLPDREAHELFRRFSLQPAPPRQSSGGSDPGPRKKIRFP